MRVALIMLLASISLAAAAPRTDPMVSFAQLHRHSPPTHAYSSSRLTWISTCATGAKTAAAEQRAASRGCAAPPAVLEFARIRECLRAPAGNVAPAQMHVLISTSTRCNSAMRQEVDTPFVSAGAVLALSPATLGEPCPPYQFRRPIDRQSASSTLPHHLDSLHTPPRPPAPNSSTDTSVALQYIIHHFDLPGVV